MTTKIKPRRPIRRTTPDVPAPRLILLPDNLDAAGDPRPALAMGRAITEFATIPDALAAKQAMEAGR